MGEAMNISEFYRKAKILGLMFKFPGDSFSKVWRDNTSELFTRGGAGAPTATLFQGGIPQYEFVSNLMKEVFTNFHINHDYSRGSTIFPHFHFSPKSNNSGVVLLEFEWSIAKGHQQAAFPVTTKKTLAVTIPANSAYLHFIAELPEVDAISGANIEPDTLIIMRIARLATNPADTFPDSIWGATADLHYQADMKGTLNRAPDFYLPGD